MSVRYKFRNQEKLYFISFSVVYWIDLFIRNEYKNILIDSLRFCQKEKGLDIYAWCIMTSHVHMIIGTRKDKMENIMRDYKSHTSRTLKKAIKDNPIESRKEWMLWLMERAGKKNSNNANFQLWRQDNHPIELWDNYMLEQKLNYIHQNPVEAGIVDKAENYTYSSAGDYSDKKGLLDIILIR